MKNPKSQEIVLAKGMPMVSFKNNKDKKTGNEWLNGETFVI